MKNIMLVLCVAFAGCEGSVIYKDRVCVADADCPGGATCDVGTGLCVVERVTERRCANDAECPEGGMCDVARGLCLVRYGCEVDFSLCDDGDVRTTDVCTDGICNHFPPEYEFSDFTFCQFSAPGAGCCGPYVTEDVATEPGMLIKGSVHSVYFIGDDGRRYIFPTTMELTSWFANDVVDQNYNWRQMFPDGTVQHICAGVTRVSDDVLSAIPIGGNVSIRPATYLLGIRSDPGLYVVSRGRVLREVSLETAQTWWPGESERRVRILWDGFFVNYFLGEQVAAPGDYDPGVEAGATLADEMATWATSPGM